MSATGVVIVEELNDVIRGLVEVNEKAMGPIDMHLRFDSGESIFKVWGR